MSCPAAGPPGGEDLAPRCEEQLTPAALNAILGFQTPFFAKFQCVFVHADAAPALGMPSYDRYEFMGDACINLVCAKWLYDRFPDADEGFLTRSRSKLVCTKGLADLSSHLGLWRYAVVTQKAFDAKQHQHPRVAEDLFEALVGCVYETHGLVSARNLFLRALEAVHGPTGFACLFQDSNYKNAMMCLMQAGGLPLPTYHAIPPREGDPRGFTMRCMYAGNLPGGFGHATTKKEAEQLAARSTLSMLGYLTSDGYVGAIPTKAQIQQQQMQQQLAPGGAGVQSSAIPTGMHALQTTFVAQGLPVSARAGCV